MIKTLLRYRTLSYTYEAEIDGTKITGTVHETKWPHHPKEKKTIQFKITVNEAKSDKRKNELAYCIYKQLLHANYQGREDEFVFNWCESETRNT